MYNLKIEAPWYTFQKKVKALFEGDNDIIVGDIYDMDEDSQFDFAFDIEVTKHEKAEILQKLMPTVRTFGNIVLGIYIYDEENLNSNDKLMNMYEKLFEGNPIVKDFKVAVDQAQVAHGYVRFKPEVVQFFDDDLTDYSGNWTGLAEDIARELFIGTNGEVNFCTAGKNEP